LSFISTFYRGNARDLDGLQFHWGAFLVLGVALVLVGLTALAYPAVATITTVEIFGVLLVIAGVVELTSALWARRWGGMFQHVLVGLLYLFLGVLIVERPGLGAAGYTLMLAMFFIAAGTFRVVYSIDRRFPGWGLALLGGAVSIMLGLMIWRELPGSALWVIGTFLGIDLLFSGFSWVMLALAVKGAFAPAKSAAHAPAKA
jgi:uncharacterized membrane protein HdeD (DUF308 family)